MRIRLSTFKTNRKNGKLLKGIALSAALLLFSALNAQTGTWYAVANTAPDFNMGVMLLMPDGTVIAHDATGGSVGTGWDKLTPDATGSYINGTWSQISSMANDRLFFFSQVMPNGKVVVGGGEYGAGATHAEVYDPVLNTWTATGAVPSNQNIYDGNAEILPNGNTLVGIQNGLNPSYNIAQYVPGTNSWLTEANSPLNHDEAAWLKLPDNSVLFVGIGSTSSCRYIPATNTWVSDGTVPVQLYDPYGLEAGAAEMLPNGKAIFFGSTGHNAIYTPSGNTSPGTWTTAVDFPKINGTEQVGTVDAPAASLPNGRILCAASPVNLSNSNQFRAPTYFFEYNYLTNTFAQVTSSLPLVGADSIGINCDFTTFLLLPDGSVLLGINQTSASKQYWDYVPAGANIPQGKPVLNNIWQTACGNTYYMSGKLFNGISEGAAFGDDWQMSTNYPLVRLINGANVYYCKTSNWNRIGWVQTDSLMDTAQFTLPAALPAGTYTLQVVVNGFPSSNWIFSTWGLTATVVSNVNCRGASTGSAQATPTGGNPAYTYSWAPSGGTSATATGLSAGTYTVTLKDRLGCTLTASVTITQPATSVAASIVSQVNVSCRGASTGSINSSASGGTSPYTYAWTPSGGNAANATGLSAGTYTITVTDNKGCTATASATITQPATGVSVSITSQVNVKCKGNSTGSINSTASGGNTPYTYTWTPSGGNAANATGLSAGTYTITVKDNTGCTATASATITQPAAVLSVSIASQVNVKCKGNSTGSINSSASGGTSPYTYAWTPSGGNAANATGLSAGTYTVTVTDNQGCTATTSATITQPASALSVSITSQVNVKCRGNSTGSINSSASGGTGIYTYAWSPSGGNASNATGLAAGSYTVTVTDGNGCTATASATITQPATSLGVSTSGVVNVRCNGASTGSINSTASGGTGIYTYAWTPAGGNAANATGLSAGTYTITVTDGNGCTATASATITQPTALTVAASTTANISCNSGSGGSTHASPAGGTGIYTYSWSPAGGAGQNATGLSAGSYTVTVTDGNGCTVTASTSVTQPAVLVDSAIVTNINCSSQGKITSNTTGGTPGYTYSWSNSATTANITGLSAGTYSLTLTDSHGCSFTASYTITQPAPIAPNLTVNANVSCNSGSNGQITSTPTGGNSPYTFSWSNSSTNASVSNLTAGSYTVTVTDNTGCTATASATITEPNALTLSLTVTANENCNGGGNGSIASSTGGGTPAYSYSWSNGATSANGSGLTAGSYTLTVTDNNGCSITASATITEPTALTAITSVGGNIVCNGGSGGTAQVTAGGGTGAYTYSWSNGATNSAISALTGGTYAITVTDGNGCTSTATAIITQPTAITLVQGSKGNTSTKLCNGQVWVTPSGGSPGYTYLWSPGGATTDTVKGLCNGKYCCTVTDSHGCKDSTCVNVVTGIQGISNASSIKIFPDPNNGYFTISGLSKGQIVEMYDYLGQKLSSVIADNNSDMHVNIANKPNGVYLVRIITKDGEHVDDVKIMKTK